MSKRGLAWLSPVPLFRRLGSFGGHGANERAQSRPLPVQVEVVSSRHAGGLRPDWEKDTVRKRGRTVTDDPLPPAERGDRSMSFQEAGSPPCFGGEGSGIATARRPATAPSSCIRREAPFTDRQQEGSGAVRSESCPAVVPAEATGGGRRPSEQMGYQIFAEAGPLSRLDPHVDPSVLDEDRSAIVLPQTHPCVGEEMKGQFCENLTTDVEEATYKDPLAQSFNTYSSWSEPGTYSNASIDDLTAIVYSETAEPVKVFKPVVVRLDTFQFMPGVVELSITGTRRTPRPHDPKTSMVIVSARSTTVTDIIVNDPMVSRAATEACSSSDYGMPGEAALEYHVGSRPVGYGVSARDPSLGPIHAYLKMEEAIQVSYESLERIEFRDMINFPFRFDPGAPSVLPREETMVF